MAYRFMLEAPGRTSELASIAVSAVDGAQVVVARPSIAEGFDIPYSSLTIAAQNLRVIEALYDWFATLPEPRPPVRLVLYGGDRIVMNDRSSSEVVAAIRRDQPWVERTIPRIGEHAETVFASRTPADTTASVASDSQIAVAAPAHLRYPETAAQLLTVQVTDLDKAVRFYREFFGLEPLPRLQDIKVVGDLWQELASANDDEAILRNGPLTLQLQRVGLGSFFDRDSFEQGNLLVDRNVLETMRGWALMRSLEFLSNTTDSFSIRDPFGMIWNISLL